MQVLDRLGLTSSLYIEKSKENSDWIFSGLVSAWLQTLEDINMMLQLAMGWDVLV